MKKRLDIVQSFTEPSKEVLWMTGGTLRYWGNNGWVEVNKSHNEIPSSGKDGQYLRYGKNGLEWGSVDVPAKLSQLTNDKNFISEVPTATADTVGGVKQPDLSYIDFASATTVDELKNKIVTMLSDMTEAGIVTYEPAPK